MLSVKNNLTALSANRQMKTNKQRNSKTMEKLSSGYRINKAADDAAGLTISEAMRYQIRGLNRASKNIQEGISLIQVADGGMDEITGIIHRMKELSVQSANATNTQDDRACIQKEIDSLLLEIDDIHEKTLFNGIRVLDGASRLVGGGSTGSGHYGDGFYVKGSLPDWIKNSSGTTQMGYLTDSTMIKNWTKECTSITKNGQAVTGPIVTNDGTYQAGQFVFEPTPFGNQNVQGMDTLSKTDGMQVTEQITDINGNTYTANITYRHESKSYATAYLDFSNVTAGNIGQLLGGGFFTTCTMCDRRYSIEFVDQGGTGDGRRYASLTSNDFIYSVDIHGITNGNDLIDKIVSVLGDTRWNGSTQHKYQIDGHGQYLTSAKPNNHYSDYAAELDANGNRTGRMVIICTAEETGSFVNPQFFPNYGLFNSGVYSYGTNVWIPDPPVPPTKIQGELHIQTGAVKGDAVLIGLPVINCDTLGLTAFSVLTEEDSGYGILYADEALDILNSERSSLGAWQNRLEHSYANVTQNSENTQAAESRLRDCDIAKETVANSIQNILLQAGASVLAQANQQPNLILSMLP